MNFARCGIPDLLEITPHRNSDDRGFFSEIFRVDAFTRACGAQIFVQENESFSRQAGTIRGLHFQTEPCAQGKLVRCTAGLLLDIAVDLRMGSPTFGQWTAVELSTENGKQLWIPPGFAHGFCTLKPNTVINYKVTAYYSAEHDKGLAWDDSAIGIEWPALADPETLSAKDRIQPRLADLSEYFRYEAQVGVSSPCE